MSTARWTLIPGIGYVANRDLANRSIGFDPASPEGDRSAIVMMDFSKMEARIMALMEGPIEEYPDLLEFIKSGKFTHRLYPYQENLMNMFEQSRKLQELSQLVRDFPDATPVMVQSEGMDRLREADPTISVSQVIRQALDEAADKAEAKKEKELKMQRVFNHANRALSDLREVVSDLEDGAVTGQYEARKMDSRMREAYRVLREAGDELRAAYGIDGRHF